MAKYIVGILGLIFFGGGIYVGKKLYDVSPDSSVPGLPNPQWVMPPSMLVILGIALIGSSIYMFNTEK